MLSDDWKDMGEWTAVERPEYYCGLQEFRRGNDQMVFIHLTMHEWTKSALKQAIADFKLLREYVTCPLYGCGEVDDKKWASFVELFGFKFLTDALCTDGQRRRIYIHTKDTNKNVQQQANDELATEFSKRTVVSTEAVPDNGV